MTGTHKFSHKLSVSSVSVRYFGYELADFDCANNTANTHFGSFMIAFL